jgi:hypothetical protein
MDTLCDKVAINAARGTCLEVYMLDIEHCRLS